MSVDSVVNEGRDLSARSLIPDGFSNCQQGMKDEEVDFPFRVSPTEQRIIELVSPSSIILLGRSGTGKTTCAVFRMYGAWLARHTDPDAAPHNMVRPACNRTSFRSCLGVHG